MAVTQLQDTQAVADEIEGFHQEMERLRSSYEQYFLGLERKEPVKQREKVLSYIRKFSGAAIKNARTKFRFQQLVARYNVYSTHWDRILREIEEGRYERDVFKAKMHESARTKRKSAEPKPADPMRTLFDNFVEAKKTCKEDTSKMTFETFKKAIQTQMETLKKKSGTDKIRFQVAVENGKAKIKATSQVKKTS